MKTISERSLIGHGDSVIIKRAADCCFIGVKTHTALSVLVEVGDFHRFASAQNFASYLGLVPGEDSSGDGQTRLGITKAGNRHVRMLLTEASQCYARGQIGFKSKKLKSRQAGNSPQVIAYADKANERLRRRYYKMVLGKSKKPNVAKTAIARELACFMWGMIAAKKAGKVFGVESNPDAVRDAVGNAKANDVKNIRFYREDAGHFLQSCAADNMPVDVVLMDPPRAGSSEEFLDAVAKIGPKRVVYVSCNPTTLERDCTYLEKQGYRAKEVWPVDMFPWSGAVEAVCLLEKNKKARIHE